MNYQTFEPSEALNALVKCYWLLDGPKEISPQRQRIVPDGCMEMLFHHGDLYNQYINGIPVIQPRSCVFGQLTIPLEIEPTGETGLFSARFHPEGFVPFTTLPIKEFENKAVPLDKIFGEAGIVLEHNVVAAPTAKEKIQIVETFLLNRLMNAATIDHIIRSTVQTILSSNGQYSVDELSRQMNITRKQLERKFSVAVGLSPKQLSKIIRLQATLKLLLNDQFTSLTTLAYKGEYYDQAHFIKDFKEFTGATPKKFYSDNLKMSTLFYGTE